MFKKYITNPKDKVDLLFQTQNEKQISINLSSNRNAGVLLVTRIKHILENTDAVQSHVYFSDGKPSFSPRTPHETEDLKERFSLSQMCLVLRHENSFTDSTGKVHILMNMELFY